MSKLPPIAELVKHADGMLLIDRLIEVDGEMGRSETTIRPDNIFFQPSRGVPAYVGFELMAQTISAYDGVKRSRIGKPVTLGFLLGCRKYKVIKPFFAEGETLVTEVISLLGEEEMASFQCRILTPAGDEVASATINTYRPEDTEAFLKAQLQ